MALRSPSPRRRSTPSGPRALQAAAIRLPKDRVGVRKSFRNPAEWQTDAWDYFDTSPPIKFGTWWAGNLLAKIELFPAVELPDGSVVAVDAIDPDTIPRNENGDPTGPGKRYSDGLIDETLAAAARAEWSRLHAEMGGQSELQRELGMNFDVAGECYLVGWAAREPDPGDPQLGRPPRDGVPETWEVRSISEVYEKDGVWHVRDTPGADGRAITEDDTIIRCYQRHPRWSALADCHMRAVLSDCRLLQVLTGQMYAEAMSRAAAGLLLMPKGMSMQRPAAPDPASGEGVGPDDGDEAKETPFIDDFTDALTMPIADPADPNSVVPSIVEAEPENLKPEVFRHMHFGRDSGDKLDERIVGRRDAIAQGLNMPVEVLLGHQQTTFANADQINEDEFVDFIEPRILLQCDVLTIGFLRPQLLDADPTSATPRFPADQVARVFVWYDASSLMDPPDLSAAADEALDRFAVSREGYRKMKRIPEEYAPDTEEIMKLLGLRRGILTAELTSALIKYTDPAFQPAVAEVDPGDGDEVVPDDEDGDAGVTAAGLIGYARRQAVLAALGAELLGLDPIALPALGMPAIGAARESPPADPPSPRAD